MHPFNVIAASAGGLLLSMTAEDDALLTGYLLDNTIGSINPPDAQLAGEQINSLYIVTSGTILRLELETEVVPDTDQTFRFIEIKGVFDSGQQTLLILREDMFYTTGSGVTRWQFSGIGELFVDGNVYQVRFA